MWNQVMLLAAAALVSTHNYNVKAEIDTRKSNAANQIEMNVVSNTKRRPRSFVHISAQPPDIARYVPGVNLEITCEATGSPAPNVQWLKNGETIMEYADSNPLQDQRASLGRKTSTIVIQKAVSGDVFTCLASSGLMTEMASTKIYSYEDGDAGDLLVHKILKTNSEPLITSFYNELFKEMGSDVILPCRVHSPTKYQLMWRDNRNDLVYANPKMKVLETGELYIANLSWEDMGEYSCVAKNAHGKVVASTFLYPAKPN